jgi:predicted ATPase
MDCRSDRLHCSMGNREGAPGPLIRVDYADKFPQARLDIAELAGSQTMLSKIHVKNFKSLNNVDISFPRLTVLFGPNAAGKSNILDAIQALSRIGTSRTVSDALSEPIRGYPIETFAIAKGGLADLLSTEESIFQLEADLSIESDHYRYKLEVAIQTRSGSLIVKDEYLTTISAKGEPKGNASIERVENQLRIRRKSKPAHPRQEPCGLNHAILSDPRLGGVEYRAIERCRRDLERWRIYYLDPRVAMRSAKPPAEVSDIGVLGEDIAPFLYRLRAEYPLHFEAIQRAIRSLVPSIESVDVDLDKRRGTLDIMIRQDGVDFSSRIVSEGTLRVLALCSIAANPWGGSLIAFEEPENGVHPRRIELIAQMLISLALDQNRQVIVTTHSPLFCDAVLHQAKKTPKEIALLQVRRERNGTTVGEFMVAGPLFQDSEISKGLTSLTEDGLFHGLILRGLLDG